MNPDLLSIDLQAEISKLALGRLRNRDQALVALARAAAAGRPGRLSIELSRSWIRLRHDGQPPGEAVVRALAILFDQGQKDALRQESLEELEARGMLDLLVPFALPARRVTLRLGEPAGVEFRMAGPDRGTRVLQTASAGGMNGVELEVSDVDLHPGRMARELAEACRYAGFPIELNRRRLDGGLRLAGMIVQHEFEGPGYRGVIGLPRQGLAATLRILVDGIRERESWESLANGRVFEAVVDLEGGRSPEGQLREAIREQGLVLYDRLRRRYPELDGADRERARQLLFRLADRGAGAGAVAGVTLFTRLNGEPVDAEALKAAAQGRLIRAVSPGARLDRFVLNGPVFVLDAGQRGFVEKHLGLKVREPTLWPRRRPSAVSLMERILGAARRIGRGLAGKQILPGESLDPGERRFLEALGRYVDTKLFLEGRIREVAFCRGRLPGWRVPGDGRLLLSRDHPRVRQMVAAFGRDPRNLFGCLVLLSEGRSPVGDLTDPRGVPILPE